MRLRFQPSDLKSVSEHDESKFLRSPTMKKMTSNHTSKQTSVSKDSILSNDEDISSPSSTRKSNRQQSYNNYRRLDSINLNISRNVSKTKSSVRHNNMMMMSPTESLQTTFESDSDSSVSLNG